MYVHQYKKKTNSFSLLGKSLSYKSELILYCNIVRGPFAV